MKANKLMVAALAMGALVFASCNSKPTPEIIIPEVNPSDVPKVDKPAEGYVTIVLNIPEGSECNGIYMKGCINGNDWSGENTYIGLEDAQADAANAVKFEAIDGSKTWFKATFKLGEGGLQGKICLKYEGDGSWQGQATGVTVDEENTTVTLTEISGEGQFVIAADAPAGVLYLGIGGWNKSECETVVARAAEFTVTIIPETEGGALPEGDVIFTGNFDEKDWGNSDRVMTKNADGTFTWKGEIPGKNFKCKVFIGDAWASAVENADGDGNHMVPDDAKFPYAVTFTYASAEEN
ncbi:MAG: hypothetical protein IJ650_02510 [Paludibacteraceae bacterium]|nr:hypothetical protein [Paludibacteraceae bacterium]